MAPDEPKAARTTLQQHAIALSPMTAVTSHAPIDRLPVEMLREIFLQHPGYVDAADTATHFLHQCTNTQNCRHHCWAVVTHVCQRWRAVALRCSALWTRIEVPSHPEWTAELLLRSGDVAPLKVSTELREEALQDGRDASFELVLGQLHRIQHLEFESFRPLTSTMVRLLATPAPMLRTLAFGGTELHGPGAPPGPLPDALHADARYFPALLSAPRLEALDVRGCVAGIALDGPCARTLRCLTVHTFNDYLPWPDSSALLTILAALPSLETVSLQRDWIEPSDPLITHIDGQCARCPKLRSLEIITSAAEACYLLNSLELPALTYLSLVAQSTGDFADVVGDALARKVPALEPARCFRVHGFGSNDPDDLKIHAYAKLVDEEGEGDEIDMLLWGSPVYDVILQDCDDHAAALHEIGLHVSFADVEMLNVEGASIPREAWVVLGETMENVRDLTVAGPYAAAHLPEALMLMDEWAGSEDGGALGEADGGAREEDLEPPQFFFPELWDLWLDDTCLSPQEDFKVGRVGEWCEALCCALRWREDAGLAPAYLHLEGCANVNEAAMAALEKAMNGRVDAGSPCASARDTSDWETYMYNG